MFIVFHKLNLTRISSLSQNLKFTQSMHDASKFKVLLPELFNYLSNIENFQSHCQNRLTLPDIGGFMGSPSDLVDAVNIGTADAIAMAHVLHYGVCSLRELRATCQAQDIPTRVRD